MKKLFIIGNGFDIQHSIKSEYSDFHSYFRSLYMNEKLVDRSFDDFSPWKYTVPKSRGVRGKFDNSELKNVLGFLDYCLTKSENNNPYFNFHVNSDWCSVEDTLSKLDLYEFFHEELYPPSHYSEEDKAYDIAESFKYLYIVFWKWVNEIDIDSISPIIEFQELFDCENDIFFTFNYTRTLEDVYGALQVRHVHGEQGKGLLFGHKKEVNIYEYCKKFDIPEYCDHAIKVLMEITEKDTEKNSSNMKAYYLFLDKDISDIYSYGFSFSEVDLPYIKDICKSIDTTKIVWHLSDFDSKERRDKYIESIVKSGFRGEFRTYTIKNTKNSSKKRQIKKDSYTQYIKNQRQYMGYSQHILYQYLLDYVTIGYERPEKHKWKQSTWFMLPRLIWLCAINFFKYIIKKIKK